MQTRESKHSQAKRRLCSERLIKEKASPPPPFLSLPHLSLSFSNPPLVIRAYSQVMQMCCKLDVVGFFFGKASFISTPPASALLNL